MSVIREERIFTYSGLSSDTKPTVGEGTDVPNGSRFRENDTGETFFFNLPDDKWYNYSSGTGESVVEGTLKKQMVQDSNSESLLSSILKELKIANLHLAILSDNYITHAEVE